MHPGEVPHTRIPTPRSPGTRSTTAFPNPLAPGRRSRSPRTTSILCGLNEEGLSMTIGHVPVTGGCLCGAVRYESREPPIRGYLCHCTMCRTNCGGFFGATVRFPGAAFGLTKGELKPYAATKFARRCFCADCGAPVAYFYAGNPDVWIYVGSLDHPED